MANGVAEDGVVPGQGADMGAGVGIEQQLVRIEPVAGVGLIRAVHAKAIDLARPDIGQPAVEELVGIFRQDDPFGLALAARIKQADLDLGGVGREQREIDALAIPVRPDGEGHALTYGVGIVAHDALPDHRRNLTPNGLDRSRGATELDRISNRAKLSVMADLTEAPDGDRRAVSDVGGFEIREDDLTGDDVRALLALHAAGMRASSPPDACFVLDLSGLLIPEITVWSIWRGPALAGVGALKRLPGAVGELKSMRTHPDHLRTGAASRLLDHMLGVARQRGAEADQPGDRPGAELRAGPRHVS